MLFMSKQVSLPKISSINKKWKSAEKAIYTLFAQKPSIMKDPCIPRNKLVMNEGMNVYEWMCIYIPHISHSVPRRFTILLEWDRTSACYAHDILNAQGLQCTIGQFQMQLAICKFLDVRESFTAKQKERLFPFLILHVECYTGKDLSRCISEKT